MTGPINLGQPDAGLFPKSDGRLVETVTHTELVEKKGAYFELIGR